MLARILNEMEDLVEEFQRDGPKQFLMKYYLRWLHRYCSIYLPIEDVSELIFLETEFAILSDIFSDAKVNLGNENGEMVTIKGLDDMGYLSVINSLNEVQSVQPDGNSFDMMRNLITIKTRN